MYVLAALPTSEALPVDVLTMEIERHERSLLQWPLFVRGYIGVAPMQGDGVFVRRGRGVPAALHFPRTMAYGHWYRKCCLKEVARLQHRKRWTADLNACCKSIGRPVVVTPPARCTAPPAAGAGPGLAQWLGSPARAAASAECRRVAQQSGTSCTFGSEYSQDWFVLRNYFSEAPAAFYVEVGAAHWRTGSDTWFMDVCLQWQGMCVVSSSQQATAWRQNRGCQVAVLCANESSTDAPDHCVRATHLLQLRRAGGVLFVGVQEGLVLLEHSPWEVWHCIDVVVVNQPPSVNYKLMFWPLALRGFAMVATLRGNDIYVRRSAALLDTRLRWPSEGKAVQWLRDEYKAEDFPEAVVAQAMLV